MAKIYQTVLFDERDNSYYDQKGLFDAIEKFNKYKTGNPEADAELWQDLLKRVKKYRVDDLEEIYELLEYQYLLR